MRLPSRFMAYREAIAFAERVETGDDYFRPLTGMVHEHSGWVRGSVYNLPLGDIHKYLR
jgi:hypothetical protein